MNNRVKTSLEMFNEWQPKYSTHADRFMKIIRRHSVHATKWKTALQNHPVGSPELLVEIGKLHQELVEIFVDCGEVMTDLGNDNSSLADIFFTFHEELKEATDDTP